ncbi:MAG: methyltransferase domain-containing protein [Proteobacteria bacterium]|nr:methyltransferase [Desulfobulbaceae bacterium]MBU4152035.1 methyltransferase domain-containing protein [Pseudomonadota bacterium]
MSRDVQRICPACGSMDWEELVHIGTGRVMTGDQRIVPGHLHKIMCPCCGVAANARVLSAEELDHLYGDSYILNTHGREEHHFFSMGRLIPRSEVFYEWILPHLPRNFKTLLEIGCGEGNVLARFADAFPGRSFFGLEGSHQACELAKVKGLSVEQGLVSGDRSLPPVDAILALNVLEHVEFPGPFLAAIHKSLGKDGRAIFTLPVQDYPGYDLFFAEHVWHFTSRHCQAVLARHGFATVYADVTHPINHGIGIFVCEKMPSADATPYPDLVSIIRNKDIWFTRFTVTDNWLELRPGKRIALFGASEVVTLLLAFTSLGGRSLVACIDEDPSRLGNRKHGIEVVAPEWLAIGKADAVLLAINPKYHATVREKLDKYQVEIFSFVEQES